MTTFTCTQLVVSKSESNHKRPVNRRIAWLRVFFSFLSTLFADKTEKHALFSRGVLFVNFNAKKLNGHKQISEFARVF